MEVQFPVLGMAGFGRIIRDHEGAFIRGFHNSIGYSIILHAELMALFHDNEICWELGFKKVK